MNEEQIKAIRDAQRRASLAKDDLTILRMVVEQRNDNDGVVLGELLMHCDVLVQSLNAAWQKVLELCPYQIKE
jgi:hypothetical protein